MKRLIVILVIPSFSLACAVDDDAKRDAYPGAGGGAQTRVETVEANGDVGEPLAHSARGATDATVGTGPESGQDTSGEAITPAPAADPEPSAVATGDQPTAPPQEGSPQPDTGVTTQQAAGNPSVSATGPAGTCAEGAALLRTMRVSTASGVNVRAAAGVDQIRLGGLADQVTVQVWKLQMVGGYDWACVTGSGMDSMPVTGWVAGGYLVEVPAEP